MSKAIHQTARADTDIASIVDYIASDNLTAALAMLDAMEATKRAIAGYPHLGERFVDPRLPELRRKLVDGFRNSSIYYQVFADEIRIVRVIHNSRDLESAIATPLA